MPDSNGDNGSGSKTTTSTPSISEEKIRSIVTEILDATGGDKTNALERLVRRNERLEGEIKALKDQVPEGGAIISEKQVKLFGEYKKLGSPEEIVKGLSERDELKTTTALRDREAKLRAAAGHHGMNPDLFVRLALQDNLVVDEVREEKDEDGEAVKVAYVRENEADAKPLRLDEYAKKEWSEFLDGLSVEGASVTPPSGTRIAPSAERGSPSRATGKVTEETVREKKIASGQYLTF